MQVTLYSTTTCPYCRMLKDYLAQRQIPYVEKLIDQDEAAKTEMMATSGGFLGVPFSVLVKPDGTRVNILGFDQGKLNAALGLDQK